MGVAPEAIVESFEYSLSHICSINYTMELVLTLHFFNNHRVARSVLPMGVAPEAIKGCLQPFIGPKSIISTVRLLYSPFVFIIRSSFCISSFFCY
jgi:hypothetical protein